MDAVANGCVKSINKRGLVPGKCLVLVFTIEFRQLSTTLPLYTDDLLNDVFVSDVATTTDYS